MKKLALFACLLLAGCGQGVDDQTKAIEECRRVGGDAHYGRALFMTKSGGILHTHRVDCEDKTD